MAKIVVDTDEVFSIEDAASQLGVSRATAFNYLKSGKMIGLKINGQRLIPQCEIVRLSKVIADENIEKIRKQNE